MQKIIEVQAQDGKTVSIPANKIVCIEKNKQGQVRIYCAGLFENGSGIQWVVKNSYEDIIQMLK